MPLKRLYWVAYAISLYKYRGWDREKAIEHVRRLYRYERARQKAQGDDQRPGRGDR